MANDIDYSQLPEHCQESMKNYLENGWRPGSFLSAVLQNDLIEAFSCADHINQHAIRDYATFLVNDAPRCSYGSPESFYEWIAKGGLTGAQR